MPNYTCTTVESVLDSTIKATLAADIARIHAQINHVPEHYVNVLFSELPADNVYSGGQPAAPLIVNGWVRDGHPDADASKLALAIAAAASRVSGLPPERVTVVFQSSPAHYAVEGGRVLPAPGEEAAWAAAAARTSTRGPHAGDGERFPAHPICGVGRRGPSRCSPPL